jgi:hypothetical protein
MPFDDVAGKEGSGSSRDCSKGQIGVGSDCGSERIHRPNPGNGCSSAPVLPGQNAKALG